MKNLLKQHGIALLVFVTVLATAATAVTVTALNRSSQNVHIARDKITAAALAQAKDALIGRAVIDENRPGSLPCPDTNNDGVAELFVGSNCPSYIGRLPWRTLGLPDISDGSRERLWYALSDRFRDNVAAEPINSDTLGNRPVYAPNTPYDQTGTLLTEPAIAVIFSVGDVLIGQNRTSANINNANHYLENLNCPGPNCRDNTSEAGPFIIGTILDANLNPLLNDRLIVITHENLFPLVEKVVGKRAAIMLNAHLSSYWGTSFYPFAAIFTNPSTSRYTPSFNNTHGLLPGTATWAGIPSYSLTGGSATVSCELNEGNNHLNDARARCSISGISDTPNITLVGTLNYLGLWRKYDLGSVYEVRIRRNGTNYSATDPALAGMNAAINYTVNTDSSVTVIFTGILLSGVTRIELRDVVIDTATDWFFNNNWQQLVYYAASPGHAPGGGNACNPLPTTPSCLTVTGNGGGNDKRAVVITTGRAITGIRPSDTRGDYLEGENATPSDYTYENNTRSDTFNDQVIVVAP